MGGKNRSDFWSRRRAAVARETEAEETRLRDAEAAEQEARLAERSDEEILEDLGLPDPDTLTDADAVRDFMQDTVPQRLRMRALRRLWRLNPVLANLDGLVDYGEDFTDAATVVENLQTTYQVGKGMLAHIEALAAKAEAKARAEESEPEGIADDDAIVTAADDVPADTTEQSEPQIAYVDTATVSPELPETDETSAPPAPVRRMQFTFETERAG